MEFEILIDNKNGNVWNIPSKDIEWKTSRIGQAGKLTLTIIKNAPDQEKAFQYNNGDVIRFRYKGINVFYGYVFSISTGKDESVKITAYDQLRYLMSNDTYVGKNVTATQVIKKFADDYKLKVGSLTDTSYKIPKLIEDNQMTMDIVCKSLDLTLIATIKNFVLYDDFGSLALKNINDMAVDIIIGDSSLMTDFTYDRSIDDDTFNRVKVYQDNKKTGKREVYIAQDSSNIAKWGRLQLLQKADDKMNSAQINELLNQLIKLKNRERKKLKLTAIGDLKIRAGSFIPVVIKELGIKKYYLVDECTHKWDGVDHTMSLDLKVI
ncbi:hypothetical protein [Bacillus sp. FJAT-49736]|uniref:XkdQ/YqbQ family protein n=1 Tax=Bacillus sp. FJAT-49736 TaxID=2833582 RepID=UPI001BCA4ABC|nr:hypothetical protein [Bacillus sp. FJAT-49736]MBS4172128.1 hypothetical protein [Bacillus sp. FJAT-49736]